MTVRVRHTGSIPKVELSALAKRIAPLIVGRILKRTSEGVGSDGNRFRSYSRRYRTHLGKMGEGSDVDLRVTGGLLTSLKLLQASVVGTRLILTFGPDTGTSPIVVPPSRGKPRATRTGRRGPQHNLLGAWIHDGTDHMPARPWLGLSKIDEDWLRDVIRNAGVRAR